ncbi:MAG: helix-turn-helix domain-containing protein [Eubacterium sp.]|nr:helix-turn-helix domain-containing protein [Eubacterium sp.]
MENIVAANIKSIIRKRGLKQSFVAEKCGYKQSTFGNILNGRLDIRERDISKICDFLDVTPNELFNSSSLTMD